ncbi:hypothetical protein J1614_007908 [Plenodomus biglobosus]|nr:hypothetical protein J1614_007908 [Plenodomus biglobosus]
MATTTTARESKVESRESRVESRESRTRNDSDPHNRRRIDNVELGGRKFPASSQSRPTHLHK